MATSHEEVVTALRASMERAERLRQQNQRLIAASKEPIAIVGMSCRYPGGVSSPQELWDLVAAGIDGISSFPSDRGWDLDKLYDPDPDHPGTSYTREGGFLHDAGEFDPEFFGIGPREALAMDPQQRLLLEGAWEALESAGIDPVSLRGTQTGVFTGLMYHDYGMGSASLPDGVEGYLGTGVAGSVLSGRVAYIFGLEGPAVTVDTACSSSLVALHFASQALRSGECSLALAGGVSVMASPSTFVGFSRQRGLSVDGRCRSYAEAAGGVGWSEGVGLVLLERLSDAQRNGRRVLAVVRGSAVNQDGASNGLTAPNGPSQQRVIGQALADAGLSPSDVDVVEGHGTGTSLGDPIEAQALLATYGRERRNGRPLWLGSVKSNIGHTQAAAGVAGVIKMVMAMRHGILPKTLHVDEPSGSVDWSAGAVSLLTEQVPWERNGEPRRAGVSSFGISGTNAHVIVEEEAPSVEGGVDVGQEAASDLVVLPFVVSGVGEGGLRAQALRLAAHLECHPEVDLGGVAVTLALGRASLAYRAVVVAGDRERLLSGLRALGRGGHADGVVEGVAGGERKAVFVFSGQGGQWEGMAAELAGSSPVFARELEACEGAFAPYLGFSLGDVLHGRAGAASLERVDVVQPALFAVMVSLAALWRSFGVEPAGVVGHSQGEIAAAYVAGALSLDDAARVVALRGRVLAEVLAGRGGMVSVGVGVERVAELLDGFAGRVSLAAVNGPSAVVVSGEPGVLREFVGVCEGLGVRAREISVDYASHSPQIEGVRERLAGELGGVVGRSGGVPFFSAVTGGSLDGALLDGGYWYRNLRETVQFERAVRSVLDRGRYVFVEVSPHPVLGMALQEIIESGDPDGDVNADADTGGGAGVETAGAGFGRGVGGVVVGSLRRGEGGMGRFLSSLAQTHVEGVECDWRPLFGDAGVGHVELPTYAFQRSRFWLESGTRVGDAGSLGLSPGEHPLLGAVVELAGDEEGVVFTGRLRLRDHPWLADHAVLGQALLPGAGFVELALAAAERVGAGGIEELTLYAPLLLEQDGVCAIQLSLAQPDESGRRELLVYSREHDQGGDLADGGWTLHASGILGPNQPQLSEPAGQDWPLQGAEELDTDLLYERLAEAGYDYGPAFQGLKRAFGAGGEIFAEVALAGGESEHAGAYGVHPALLDAALHALVLSGLEPGSAGEVMVPFSFSGVRLHGRGAASLRVRLSAGRSPSLVALDESGAAVLSIDSLETRAIDQSALRASRRSERDALYELRWAELVTTPVANGQPLDAVALGEGGPAAWVEQRYVDLAALDDAIEQGTPPPTHILLDTDGILAELIAADGTDANADDGSAGDGELARSAYRLAERILVLMQTFLTLESLQDSKLVVLTKHALAVAGGEAPDLAQATLGGLLRSAAAEHPERFCLLDTDENEIPIESLHAALASREPELAIRGCALHMPRLGRVGSGGSLVPPPNVGAWNLVIESPGTFESLALCANSRDSVPLEPGEVRVAVRAAGLNFRDVMVSLGVLSLDGGQLGGEGAGVVLEVAPDVLDLAVGDRVMGVMPHAFGSIAISDHRLLVKIPEDWSDVEAAAVPVVFLTAYYGLVDLAQLKRGEALLIHGAAGGVGMAALQIAAHIGAEIFATAHPSKWDTLRGLGVDGERISSSRTLEFRERFLEQTDGRGMDVVLDSLAREFVDASLELLPRGGRFIEMGKTDIREPAQVAAEHPGTSYRAFDLMEAGPERIQEMLKAVVELFEEGVFRHLPLEVWDVRRAPEAFRRLSQARHVGKLILQMPRPLDRDGTVLITGGTGGLGTLVARHLVAEHGVKHLLLVSRSGSQAGATKELVAELEGLGCATQVVGCDIADRKQLERVIGGVPRAHPLTAVVHAAGVLDDGTIASLDRERLAAVFAPKVHGAINLHELTEALDLCEFILFSSAAGVLGSPGQGSYAAANAFVDALAHRRRAQGLPAVSLAWGGWEKASGMTAHLDEADLARLARSGMALLSAEQGLELFDLARRIDEPLLLPASLDGGSLRAMANAGMLPAILSAVVRSPTRRAKEGGGQLVRKLQEAPESQWEAIISEVVRDHVAGVLGHASGAAIDSERPFKEAGFDSLGAVELRNRLARATDLKLPATLVFDYPTPSAVAGYLRSRIEGKAHGARLATRATPRTDEPIAIVGMSCRYPGGIASPEELWRLLVSGTDAISEFPGDRGWDVERLYDPDPDHPGTSYTRRGGFLHDAGEFDAAFFQISPREALAADPQQRLLLEAAWEAFEDAGVDPLGLRGSQTGVFAGIISSYYGAGLSGSAPEGLEGYGLTGATTSVASGRLAYTFGLEGPAVSIDTACSSSLVAMHMACQALRGGECDLMLAGGATVLATPALFIAFSRQRGLAVDGRCKAFAQAADGTGWSEGVGLLVLERLSDAHRNRHRVLATVRGSAVNQDGASNGLTAPNGPSQERVILQALANAGLSPADVDAVEAHGTGTTLGDPIEAQALIATYGQGRRNGPLRLGSVKSNIGHTQAAAGVAGVIKMVMAMRHGVLPRTLHIDEPSRYVDWEAGAVQLLQESLPWEASGGPRRAGVSSFGVSGTNAHVILEEAATLERAPAVDGQGPDSPPAPRPSVLPFLVSAASEGALTEQAARLAVHCETHPELALDEVAATLALHRASLPHRAVVVAGDRDSLLGGLGALARGERVEHVIEGLARGEGKVAFMFSGQGSQWAGMGRELYGAFPLFARSLDELCRELDGHVERPLKELLFSEQGSKEALLLDQTRYTQPALFALEVALHRLVTSFGIAPDYLIGHSIGELTAAHVAGVLSLSDACRLVAARGRLMGDLTEAGAMLAVEATEQEALESLLGFEGRLSIAAVNGPSSVVLSGEEAAIAELERHHEGQGRKTTRLRVSHAFHSQLMEPALGELRAIAGELDLSAPELPILSNVTGAPLTVEEATSPDYWTRHAREPVRFADGVRFLESEGVISLLELGSHGTLTALAHRCLSAEHEDRALLAASMRARKSDLEAFVAFLAQAHTHGLGGNWSELFGTARMGHVELPTYAFQRTRYWLSPGAGAGDPGSLGLCHADHPLLGAAVPLAGEDGGWLFTTRLSLAAAPWLADHVLLGSVVVPGIAFVELVLAAGGQLACETLEELDLEAPLVISDDAAQLQLVVKAPDEVGRRELAIFSHRESRQGQGDAVELEWTRHASGAIVPRSEPRGEASDEPVGKAWPPEGAESIDIDDFYDRLAVAGYHYGPTFMGIRTAWRRGEELFAEVALDEQRAAEAATFGVHPALSDAALQTGMLGALDDLQDGVFAVPFSFSGVRLDARGPSALRVRVNLNGDSETPDLLALDPSGAPVLSIDSIKLRPIDRDQIKAARRAEHEAMFELAWIELPVSPSNRSPLRVALLGDARVRESQDLELERIPDFEALERAVEAGRAAPDLVLAQAGKMIDGGEAWTQNGRPAGVDGVGAGPQEGELARMVLRLTERMLSLVQAFLRSSWLQEAKLVFLTEGALTVAGEETPNLAQAALPGMMRSAQSEHPGRFALIDLDGGEASLDSLHGALTSEEPQLAMRGGALHAPRLVRLKIEHGEPAPQLDGEGTVLVTGATGGLGRLLARHLAEHGARHLLLVSRGGEEADGATELKASLEELGASVRIAACDVSDRQQLQRLISQVPEAHPLTAVIHAAGVLDDGVIESLDPGRLARVMAPKVDGAIHLHELTRGLALTHFILFSSAAATLGSPGQGNYAAANAFLDALARYRLAEGLPATSMAWGAWERPTDMTGHLEEADRARFARMGVAPLSDERALELFDAARGTGLPLLLPMTLDMAALRGAARVGMLPAILRALVRVPARPMSEAGGSLASRLAGVPESEWETVVLDLVKGHVATVLGHASADAVDPRRTFKEAGFDSLGAIELRNRLGQATGVRLPATLVFDHPTPAAVAGYLCSQVAVDATTRPAIDVELDRLEDMLTSMTTDGIARERINARLRSLQIKLAERAQADDHAVTDEMIESATASEIVALLDEELGR